MSDERVKDPLGHYEATRARHGPDTTWTGLKLALLIPAAILGIGGGLWAIASTVSGLLGG